MNKEIKGLDTDNVKTSFICPQKVSRGVNMLLSPKIDKKEREEYVHK